MKGLLLKGLFLRDTVEGNPKVEFSKWLKMWCSEPGIYIFPLWQTTDCISGNLGSYEIHHILLLYGWRGWEADATVGVWGLDERKRVEIRHTEENRSNRQRKIPLASQFWFQQFVNLFFFFFFKYLPSWSKRYFYILYSYFHPFCFG